MFKPASLRTAGPVRCWERGATALGRLRFDWCGAELGDWRMGTRAPRYGFRFGFAPAFLAGYEPSTVAGVSQQVMSPVGPGRHDPFSTRTRSTRETSCECTAVTTSLPVWMSSYGLLITRSPIGFWGATPTPRSSPAYRLMSGPSDACGHRESAGEPHFTSDYGYRLGRARSPTHSRACGIASHCCRIS